MPVMPAASPRGRVSSRPQRPHASKTARSHVTGAPCARANKGENTALLIACPRACEIGRVQIRVGMTSRACIRARGRVRGSMLS
eukprot:6179295-Pleurochrysis_carterae.AAC.1